jgi:hypothetical protein
MFSERVSVQPFSAGDSRAPRGDMGPDRRTFGRAGRRRRAARRRAGCGRRRDEATPDDFSNGVIFAGAGEEDRIRGFLQHLRRIAGAGPARSQSWYADARAGGTFASVIIIKATAFLVVT